MERDLPAIDVTHNHLFQQMVRGSGGDDVEGHMVEVKHSQQPSTIAPASGSFTNQLGHSTHDSLTAVLYTDAWWIASSRR